MTDSKGNALGESRPGTQNTKYISRLRNVVGAHLDLVAAVAVLAATHAADGVYPSDSGDGLKSRVRRSGGGKVWWQAEYLKAGSDSWLRRVHGYEPRDPALAAAIGEYRDEFLTAVGAYGDLPLGIVSSVCRNVATVYARSVLVDRDDPAQVWTADNLTQVAAGLDAAGSTVEQFLSQMLRIARNHPDTFEIKKPAHTAKRDKAPPYTPGELAAMLDVIAAQPCGRTAWELDALMCLGAGAGGSARDLRFLRSDEVTVTGRRVDVVLRGKKVARTVPVAEPWATRLIRLAGERPASVKSPWLILSKSRDANVIHRLLERADWANAERPLLSRLRTTWTLERLTAGCRIDTVRELLGESTYTSIAHAASFLPAEDADTVDAALRAEVTR